MQNTFNICTHYHHACKTFASKISLPSILPHVVQILLCYWSTKIDPFMISFPERHPTDLDIFAKWSVCYQDLAINLHQSAKFLHILLSPTMSSQNQLLHRFKLQLRDLSFDDPSNLDLTQLCRLIECPVCREVPTPPIHNCVNGHFICGSCRGQLTTQTCAYCLSLLTQMRNYPLEALVSTPLVPCDYIRWGCTQGKLTLAEYEGHVQGCWAQIW